MDTNPVPRQRLNVSVTPEEISRMGDVLEVDPPEARRTLATLLRLADGTRSLADLSRALGTDPDETESLAQDLHDLGFLWLEGPAQPLSVDTFRGEFRRWLREWVQRFAIHPIWEQILRGEASPAVLVGWAAEQMHFTRTVTDHMTRAAVHAGQTPEGRALTKHFAEEWDHYYLYAQACEAVGIPRDALLRARPLASTRAITLLMRRVSLMDPLIYIACEALLEGTTQPVDGVVEFYRRAQARYGYPEGFIGAMVSHVKADEGFEHVDIFDELLAQRESLAPDLVADLLDTCATLADFLVVFNAQLAKHYAAFPAPTVRPPARTAGGGTPRQGDIMQRLHPAFWITGERAGVLDGIFRGQPVQVPSARPEEAGDAARGLPPDPVPASRALEAASVARLNLERWLEPEVSRGLAAEGLGLPLLVEWAHLLTGLPRHAATAAAECEDRELQEVLVKLAVHGSRATAGWAELVRTVTVKELSQLRPLPTTVALQLALDELAAKDTLAFCVAASLFGTPGDAEAAKRLAAHLAACAPDLPPLRQHLDAWVRQLADTSTSYSSVQALRDVGYPYAGDLVELGARVLAPSSGRALSRSMEELQALDDSLEMFFEGVRIFVKERGEAWPRLELDWVGL